VSQFTSKRGRDQTDGAIAVDEASLSERNRRGLELIRRWRRECVEFDGDEWDEFERFLATHRLDLSR